MSGVGFIHAVEILWNTMCTIADLLSSTFRDFMWYLDFYFNFILCIWVFLLNVYPCAMCMPGACGSIRRLGVTDNWSRHICPGNQTWCSTLKQTWNEYLHHRNIGKSYTKFAIREPIVKHVTALTGLLGWIPSLWNLGQRFSVVSGHHTLPPTAQCSCSLASSTTT